MSEAEIAADDKWLISVVYVAKAYSYDFKAEIDLCDAAEDVKMRALRAQYPSPIEVSGKASRGA